MTNPRLRTALLLASGLSAAAGAAERTCPAATTLDALVTCIRQQLPGSGSNGFVIPNATEQADWRWVVRQMLNGACDFAPRASLSGIMQVRTFADTANGKSYCLFMEVLDANNNGVVDRGWGTFIVDPNAQRELSHQAPHPIYDSTTENEAVGIFRDTSSRSFLMCGAHRNANSQTSPCQSSYQVADCAHNVANMFQPTVEELLSFYGTAPWHAIQWHGMAADSCSQVEAYLTHGMNQAPVSGDKILALKNNVLLYHPAWKVEVPGAGACSLNGTTNVQGRLLNGVPAGAVCQTNASAYTGAFLHIEQDPGFRTAADWVPAVSETWPVGPVTPPAAPTGLTATAGKKRITLAWTASSGAASYKVKRSTVNGGPYSIIAPAVTATTYVNTGLRTGTTYYYVVSAVNAAGESPNSGQASATAK